MQSNLYTCKQAECDDIYAKVVKCRCQWHKKHKSRCFILLYWMMQEWEWHCYWPLRSQDDCVVTVTRATSPFLVCQYWNTVCSIEPCSYSLMLTEKSHHKITTSPHEDDSDALFFSLAKKKKDFKYLQLNEIAHMNYFLLIWSIQI